MNMRFFLFASAVVSALYLNACKSDSPAGGTTGNSDIPADPTGVTVPATTQNNITPVAQFARTSGNESRIQVNTLGIVDPTTGQPIVYSANSNFFLTEDGVVKGIKVTRAGGLKGVQGLSAGLPADVVFVVDNSGSMGEEADSIASKIVAFNDFLIASGIDLRVGCVGYDGNVTGAINLGTAQQLRDYLNRPFFTGTSRTVGFSGADSARFETVSNTFASGVFGENGVVGTAFADSLFSFRGGTQRIYINFTDEPTQPGGQIYWSSEGLCARWSSVKGTIFTVWSGGADTSQAANGWVRLQDERPWELSLCTGGTLAIVNSDASNLDLTTLPVTLALGNSYLVEFVTSNANTSHNVAITIRNTNAAGVVSADGTRTYTGVTY